MTTPTTTTSGPKSPSKSTSFLSARDLWSRRTTTTTTTSSSTTPTCSNNTTGSEQQPQQGPTTTRIRDQLSARSLASSFPFEKKRVGLKKTFSASFQANNNKKQPRSRKKNDIDNNDDDQKNNNYHLKPQSAATSSPVPTTATSTTMRTKKSTAPSRRSSSHEVIRTSIQHQTQNSPLHRASSSSIVALDKHSYAIRNPKPIALLDRCQSLPSEKSVSFRDQDEIREIERRLDLSPEIFQMVWWNEDEYMEMRKDWETVLFLLENGKDVCEETLSARGLHKRTESGAWDLFEIQRDAQNAVFQIQEEQVRIYKKIVDPEQIASAYGVIATKHREEAHQQGILDAKEARQIAKNLKTKKKKKKNIAGSTSSNKDKKSPTKTKKKSGSKALDKRLPPSNNFNDSLKGFGSPKSSSSVAPKLPDAMFEKSVSFNPEVSFIKNVKVKDMQKAIDRRWLGKDDLARIEADFKAVIQHMENGVEIDETTESIRGLEMSTESGAMELQNRRTTALRLVLEKSKTDLAESLAKAYYDATKQSRKQAQKLGRSDHRAAKEARVRRRSIGQSSSSFRSLDEKGDLPASAISLTEDRVEPEFVRLARRRQHRRSSLNDISSRVHLVPVEEPTENNEEMDNDNDGLSKSHDDDVVVVVVVAKASNAEITESIVVTDSATDAPPVSVVDPLFSANQSTMDLQVVDLSVPDNTSIQTHHPSKQSTDLESVQKTIVDPEVISEVTEQKPTKPQQRRRLSSSHAPSLRNLEATNDEKDKDQNPSLLWIRQRELLKSVGRRSPKHAPSTHWERHRSSQSFDGLKNKLKTSLTDEGIEIDSLPTRKSCPTTPSVPLVASDPETSSAPNKTDLLFDSASLNRKPEAIQLPPQTRSNGVARLVSDMTECSSSIQSQSRTNADASPALVVMQAAVTKLTDEDGIKDSFGRQGSGHFSVLSGEDASHESHDNIKDDTSSKSSWHQALSVFSGSAQDAKWGKAMPNRSFSPVPRVSSKTSVGSFKSAGTPLTIMLSSARVAAENTDCNRSSDQSAESIAGRITILSVEEEIETGEDESLNNDLNCHELAIDLSKDAVLAEGSNPIHKISSNHGLVVRTQESMDMQSRKVVSDEFPLAKENPGELEAKHEPINSKAYILTHGVSVSSNHVQPVNCTGGPLNDCATVRQTSMMLEDPFKSSVDHLERVGNNSRDDGTMPFHAGLSAIGRSTPHQTQEKMNGFATPAPTFCAVSEKNSTTASSEEEKALGADAPSDQPSPSDTTTITIIDERTRDSLDRAGFEQPQAEQFLTTSSDERDGNLVVATSEETLTTQNRNELPEQVSSTSMMDDADATDLPVILSGIVGNEEPTTDFSEVLETSESTPVVCADKKEPTTDSAVPAERCTWSVPAPVPGGTSATSESTPVVCADKKEPSTDSAVPAERCTWSVPATVPVSTSATATEQPSTAAGTVRNCHENSEKPAPTKLNILNRLVSEGIKTEPSSTIAVAAHTLSKWDKVPTTPLDRCSTACMQLDRKGLESSLRQCSLETINNSSLAAMLTGDTIEVEGTVLTTKEPQSSPLEYTESLDDQMNSTTIVEANNTIIDEEERDSQDLVVIQASAQEEPRKKDYICIRVRVSDLVKIPTADGRVVYLIVDPSILDE